MHSQLYCIPFSCDNLNSYSIKIHQYRPIVLPCSKGPKWVSRRKLLTPSFHFSILEKFLPTMIEHAQRLSDRLCGLSDSPAMDIIPIITMTSLDTIFGKTLKCATSIVYSFV